MVELTKKGAPKDAFLIQMQLSESVNQETETQHARAVGSKKA
jgi:hypothetical protein